MAIVVFLRFLIFFLLIAFALVGVLVFLGLIKLSSIFNFLGQERNPGQRGRVHSRPHTQSQSQDIEVEYKVVKDKKS